MQRLDSFSKIPSVKLTLLVYI